MKKMYLIMFDTYDVIHKKSELNHIFGVDVYNEQSVKAMLQKIKDMYSKEQIFEEKDNSFKVHVYYGNDLFFYINELNVVEDL